MNDDAKIALPDTRAAERTLAEDAVADTQMTALRMFQYIPVAGKLLDAHRHAEIRGDEGLQGRRRERPLDEQAGKMCDGFVVDSVLAVAEPIAQRGEAEPGQREHRPDEPIARVRFVLERKPVLLPGLIKQAHEAVGKDVEKGARRIVPMLLLVCCEPLRVVDRQHTGKAEQAHEARGKLETPRLRTVLIWKRLERLDLRGRKRERQAVTEADPFGYGRYAAPRLAIGLQATFEQSHRLEEFEGLRRFEQRCRHARIASPLRGLQRSNSSPPRDETRTS